MNLIKKKDGKLAIIPKGNLPEVPSPYRHDVYLFSTYVAGTTHVKDIDLLVTSFLDNEEFTFYREPDNEHDSGAIVVKNKQNKKIGYIPKADNIIFARLMDAGKLLFGRLTGCEVKGKWHKISIDIYLRD